MCNIYHSGNRDKGETHWLTQTGYSVPHPRKVTLWKISPSNKFHRIKPLLLQSVDQDSSRHSELLNLSRVSGSPRHAEIRSGEWVQGIGEVLELCFKGYQGDGGGPGRGSGASGGHWMITGWLVRVRVSGSTGMVFCFGHLAGRVDLTAHICAQW